MDLITTKDKNGITRLICNDCDRKPDECLSCEKLRTALDTLHAYETTLKRLTDSISLMSEVNDKVDTAQALYVVEECSELIKELIKRERGKENSREIIDEACDVLGVVFTLLHRLNVGWLEITDRIVYKCNRAAERLSECE